MKADYGIDAPTVLRRFVLIAALAILVGVVCLSKLGRLMPGPAIVAVGISCLWIGLWFLLIPAFMIWGSKVGKLKLRDRVLAGIPWRGDEIVLDVGCGHGLMLIGGAKRLSSGWAIGIDIWQVADQAGNSPYATLENIHREDVDQQVALIHADARQICFANDTFDVVLSSWALHNIYDPAEREKAVREIIRVLKPGGRVAIVDIRHAGQYEQVLSDAGMEQVHRHGPNFLFFIPSHTVSATKQKTRDDNSAQVACRRDRLNS